MSWRSSKALVISSSVEEADRFSSRCLTITSNSVLNTVSHKGLSFCGSDTPIRMLTPFGQERTRTVVPHRHFTIGTVETCEYKLASAEAHACTKITHHVVPRDTNPLIARRSNSVLHTSVSIFLQFLQIYHEQ